MAKKYDNDHISPELAEQIARITDAQMNELLPLIVHRCNQLRSDVETLFLFLPTEPEKRAEAFRQIVRSLRDRCNIPADDESGQ